MKLRLIVFSFKLNVTDEFLLQYGMDRQCAAELLASSSHKVTSAYVVMERVILAP